MFEPGPEVPRIVSFRRGGRPGWGVLRGSGIAEIPGSLRAALEGAGLDTALAVARGNRPLSQVELTIPLPDPEKIICVGVNFPAPGLIARDEAAAADPPLFLRLARSFTAHGLPLIRPPDCHQLEGAGAIALVIGKTGRRIPEAQALDHVAGLTLANAGGLCDRARHDGLHGTASRNFDASGAMGPWLVPLRDPAQLADIPLETLVNGALRQQGSTGRMIWPFRRIIAEISRFTTLVPGDTILCGTPARSGASDGPPLWLQPGDRVEVRAASIGRLVNTVADETPA